ncbi:MAG TPA: biosynthetic arginine decarboxylase [Gammaproteobacteria bacterium]|nr:biosynthetic arginine decarboxylase [Gammaproteobacteria bacterium]
MTDDSIKECRDIYNVARWGEGYFDISPEGHTLVYPTGNREDGAVDLYDLASRVDEAGLSLPVLFRFGDIIRHRIESLTNAFAGAMESYGYQARYTAVYPIKVNQQRSVLEDILQFGADKVGMEAGSKPELMAVLALAPERSTIVCNGYKDREYLELALIGQQLGHKVYIVVEKLNEIDHIIELTHRMNVRPTLGVRVRIANAGGGRWADTGGEKSKFGLLASQLLEAVSRLEEAGMKDCLQLLHFHLGSQLANIRDIARGMRESARAYAEMHALGVPITTMDVGGGLGIDYEGTRSRRDYSTNYSMSQYANTIVRTLWEVCEEYSLPHPDIITESGRAMTAHHAVLVTNVVDAESVMEMEPEAPSPEDPMILHDLWEGYENTDGRAQLEIYQDAIYWLQEAQAMYIHGVISLEQRARAEQLYYAICRRVRAALKPAARGQREMVDELNEKLADKYFCNMSVFQSLPDVWAIDQIFPIMPVHRLNEVPTRRAVIQDMTCDSDGRIEQYVDRDGLEATLAVHPLQKDQDYLLGFFLVGAYQEILGDLHNLFGDTDSVNVERDENGSFVMVRPEKGDRADEVLAYVHLYAEELLACYREKLLKAGLDKKTRTRYMEALQEGLTGYTYLEK